MHSSPALDSAIAKSARLSHIIWASSSTTHFAIKQLVRHARRLNQALVRLHALPAARHDLRATFEACDRQLDACVGFVDECISFRRDSVLTPEVAALSVDRDAFPTGRALLLSGELLSYVEQLETSLRDLANGRHDDAGPPGASARLAPADGPSPAEPDAAKPDFRRSSTATVSSMPHQKQPAVPSSIPAFSMIDEYQQGVDVRTRYQLKRSLAVPIPQRHAPAPTQPQVLTPQATPSIMPSSLPSTCSTSPGISALASSPSLHQSSLTSMSMHSPGYAPSTAPVRKRLHSISLGPAYLPEHVAVLHLFTHEGHHLPRDTQLLCWRKTNHPDGAVMTWSIKGSDDEFVHYLPGNVFPLTLHKDHNEGSVVQFNTLHKTAIRSGNSERFFSSTRVVYEFVQDESFMCFQEDIRDKHLVEVFDFHQILSSRSGHSTYGEAIHGHVKIWRDREPPFHHSISFYGNNLRRDLEFNLLQFQSQMTLKRPEKRVKLSFVLPKKTSDKRTFRGFFPKRSSKSESSTPTSDQASDISEIPTETLHLMTELKFLELRFDTIDDFDRFTKTMHETRTTDEARLATPSVSDITTELENTSITSELPAERETAELESILLTSPSIRPRFALEHTSPSSSPRLPST